MAETYQRFPGGQTYTAKQQEVLQRTRESNAAREAANSPADMAAYKSRMFDNYAKMQARDGKPESAKMWSGWAKEQEAKARQLGYKGDIAKSTVKDPAAKPTPASTQKPAPVSPAIKPTPSAAAPQKTSADALKKSDDEYTAGQIKKAMASMQKGFEGRASVTDQFKKNDQIKSLKGEIEFDRKAEQNWKDKAAKAATPDQKEHAMQMAAEYADKAKKRETTLKELEKSAKPPATQLAQTKKPELPKSPQNTPPLTDIPKLSEPVKKTNIITVEDPLIDLMKDLPLTLDNSSAYNTGGSGGGSGASGFFTRDGKVRPIT